MRHRFSVILFSVSATILLALGQILLAAEQEFRPLVSADSSGPNLLRSDQWGALTPEGSNRADRVFSVNNQKDASAQRGFHQMVRLNQKQPLPIIATVSSRAQDVGGNPDSDYSLYLDIIYTDGTPLWGQIAVFPTGSSDWQRQQVLVLPEKPIREVHYYLLLRRHTGRADFRDPVLTQVNAQNVAIFDGVAVQHHPLKEPEILIRDVTTGTGFRSFRHGKALEVKMTPGRSGDGPTITLRSNSEGDRAYTVIYTIPLPAGDWRWLHDPITTTVPAVHRDMVNALPCAAGARGLLCRYPFAAVANGSRGEAVAIDLSYPAVYRAGFSTDTRELYIAFDVALTKERPQIQLAVFRFAFDAKGGFRSALARYYELDRDAFQVHVKRQGLWMPFAPISKVEGWQDFGFAFKEGNDEVQWDDQHDVLTFRYTEPLTWWMALPPATPRTIPAALAHARSLAESGDAAAKALFTSGYHNAQGDFAGRIQKQPWCDGIVWSINSAPGITPAPNDFANKWNTSLRESLYGPKASGRLDGEYIDSSEGYITDELDFRREHFAMMQTPLTFDTATRRPAIFRGLIAFEYVHGIAQEVRLIDRLMMANGTPHALPWLAPMLDVMGTETDWNYGGKWQPMSLEEMLYRRAMCGGKPYCFLMNTNFDQFPPQLVEKYMQRCMAFGMFPGFFSHNAAENQYFATPRLYNRDRPLFRKYIPLCRTLAEAGWRPVTGATSSNPVIHLERFGDNYLTALNLSSDRQSTTITLALPTPFSKCTALPAHKPVPVHSASVELALSPEEAIVLELR